MPSNTKELNPKHIIKDSNEEKQESSYGLSDFLFDERFVYPKAYDKKAWSETLTSGGLFSRLSILLNTFGTEYGISTIFWSEISL